MGDVIFNNVKLGVFIVVVILILMYVLMPDMFEEYIMMNIPMYKLNAVKSIRFKDAKLNMLLNKAHASFGAVLSSYQGEICKKKNDIISLIKDIKNQMKNSDINELNKMCKANSASDAKLAMFSSDELINSESNYYKDVIKPSPETIKMAKNVFDIYEYAAIKYFCKRGKFDIEMLKDYLIAMVEDSCSDSSNNNQMANVAYNFITRKPLSYMNL
jgi:hypothetical protein